MTNYAQGGTIRPVTLVGEHGPEVFNDFGWMETWFASITEAEFQYLAENGTGGRVVNFRGDECYLISVTWSTSGIVGHFEKPIPTKVTTSRG